MNYILELLPIVPAVAIISAGVYFVVYKAAGKKRVKLTRRRLLAEFVLTGWFVTFFYVTQIKSFGNGMGDLYNLRPLHPFYIALRYGSNNANMVWQFLLNILMFIPLGFLLPIVFPKKLRTWPRDLAAIFSITLVTELLQLISKRGTDIDDVIANTVGGLCGFALFVILFGIISSIKKESTGFLHYRINLAISIVLLCISIAPFLVIHFTDSLSEFGNLYYGHLQPSDVKMESSVGDEAVTGIVYKYKEHKPINELKDNLLTATGFNGKFVLNGDTWELADGDYRRIFIYPYNKWSVYYHYSEENKTNNALIPNEDEALKLAWQYLEPFDITPNAAQFVGTSNESWADGNQHLEFESINNVDGQIVYGNISVAIGENGELIELGDARIWGDFYKKVECISAKESVSIARDVGVGEWNGSAYISSIKSGYSFIEDTGYLIPVWNISAKLITASGTEYDWSPVIDAIK